MALAERDGGSTPPESDSVWSWKTGPQLPVGLGGSVFGWLVDSRATDAILDRFFELGGRFIDTSDGYSYQARDSGGDSESLIGSWITRRGVADDVRIITKVGLCPGVQGLSSRVMADAVQASLDRLRVPALEAVLAHADDEVTPADEIADRLGGFVGREARHVGVSRFAPERLNAILTAADRLAAPPVSIIQEEFSLAHRAGVTDLLACSADRPPLGLMCSAALARGYLTGKFQRAVGRVGHRQAFVAEHYNRPEHEALLDQLWETARNHDVKPAVIALRWLIQNRSVLLPLASVTDPRQLNDFADTAGILLSHREYSALADAASRLER